MDFSRAFDKTLTDWGISAKWLAQESGVNEVVISRFRTGITNPTAKTLAQLLEALSLDVRMYYFSLLLGTDIKPSLPTVQNQIEQMDGGELSQLLGVIADKLSTLHNAAKASEREEKRKELAGVA
jgi:transcriptional regulator with XRE-family HTH domain